MSAVTRLRDLEAALMDAGYPDSVDAYLRAIFALTKALVYERAEELREEVEAE